MARRKIRILSLDGGGIRGILSGSILKYMEDRLIEQTGNDQLTLASYFDMVVGTSTGGILSILLSLKDQQGNYVYSASQALDLYIKQGDKIFDRSIGRRIRSAGGLLDEKYDEGKFEQLLKEYLGDATLADTGIPCLITAYDIRARKAHFFSSATIDGDMDNFYLRDVARATAAAPTYFEPEVVKSLYGNKYDLIDGGVFANNPSLCAYAEARRLKFSGLLDHACPDKPFASDMMIVSIGTGAVKESYPFKEFKDAGALKWIKPLIDIMMSGNSETVDYQLRKIYETLGTSDSEDYHRIQPEFLRADSRMDNADSDNINNLIADGLTSIENNREEVDEIIEKLVKYGPTL